LLPASRAAALLGISSRTVANWVGKGWLASTPGVGTIRLVDPAELEALAAERLSGERRPAALDRAIAGLATAVVEHVDAMVSRRLDAAEQHGEAAYAAAVELVRETAERLARCDAERAELQAQTQRLHAREHELNEARRQHVLAREGYETRRAELSRAMLARDAGKRAASQTAALRGRGPG
jgi:hypothetical protein